MAPGATTADHGHLREVEPKIVLEVAFNAIMRSDRHDSGYALRFPRIVRVREDKLPKDSTQWKRWRRFISDNREGEAVGVVGCQVFSCPLSVVGGPVVSGGSVVDSSRNNMGVISSRENKGVILSAAAVFAAGSRRTPIADQLRMPHPPRRVARVWGRYETPPGSSGNTSQQCPEPFRGDRRAAASHRLADVVDAPPRITRQRLEPPTRQHSALPQ